MAEKRHAAAAVAARFRTERAKRVAAGRPVATRRPLTVRRLRKKARSDTSHSRAGFAGAKRGGRSSSGFRNRYETPWRPASRGKTDCPNPDESFTVDRPRPMPRPARTVNLQTVFLAGEPLGSWARAHVAEILTARRQFDAKAPGNPARASHLPPRARCAKRRREVTASGPSWKGAPKEAGIGWSRST